MKKSAFILLALTMLPAISAADALTPVDFQYCAEVQGPVTAGSLYQLHLDEELLGKAGPGFEDLRLFEGPGREVPAVVIGDIPPHEAVETYTLEITGYDSDASSATVIMKLPVKHRPISVLDLEIPENDFKKRATLSHSSDNKTWRPLAEDGIYDFSATVAVRKTRLEFAKTDARYFRLKLADYTEQAAAKPAMRLTYEGLDFRVQGAGRKNLRISAVQGGTQRPGEKQPVYDRRTVENIETSADKDGNTVLTFKAALPLDRLSLDVANPYYHRIVHLYGSATGKTGSFHLLASQVIYRFPLSSEQREERNFLEPHAPKQAFYKIVIINKNNPVLEIKGITLSWVRQNLYFIALNSDRRHSLCCGNSRINRPEYDLVNFVNQQTLSRHPFERRDLAPLRASGGPRMTFAERFAGAEKLILKIVIVLLVIGMGVWLFTLLKKAPGKK